MHRIAAASCTSIGIPPNVMGMASGTIGGGGTSGKGMGVAWHLAGSQRHRGRTAGFLHGIKVAVTGIDPHRAVGNHRKRSCDFSGCVQISGGTGDL